MVTKTKKTAGKTAAKLKKGQTTLKLSKKDQPNQQRIRQKAYRGKGIQKDGYTFDILKDAARHARPIGRRISRNGKIYYEYRDNRTDTEGEMYAGMSALDKKGLKIQGDYGVIYHGGELVTPPEKRKHKKLTERELIAVVRTYEAKIHRRPVENLLYFDECGNVISHCVGKSPSVYIDKDAEDLCALNVHNHPYNSMKPAPQSVADVRNFFRHKAPIARVCSYGTTYTYHKGKNYDVKRAREVVTYFTFGDLERKMLDAQATFLKAAARKYRLDMKVTRKGGRLYTTFKNPFNLPERTYHHSIKLAMQYYSYRFGTALEMIHESFVNDLRKKGVDVTFTVGGLRSDKM